MFRQIPIAAITKTNSTTNQLVKSTNLKFKIMVFSNNKTLFISVNT